MGALVSKGGCEEQRARLGRLHKYCREGGDACVPSLLGSRVPIFTAVTRTRFRGAEKLLPRLAFCQTTSNQVV